MQRYDMFHQPHKGLRALLCDTAMHMLRTDFWNVEEAASMFNRLREMVLIFDRHAQSQDRFVSPAVKKYEPSVADLFEQEHTTGRRLGKLLLTVISRYEEAPVITAKAGMAARVHKAFNAFMVSTLEHMDKEGETLCPILWRYYADRELFSLSCQMASNAPARAMAIMNKWMLRGLNTGEITCWLQQVEANAPAPVFRSLLSSAENELNGQCFRQVLKGMSRGVAAA